jgi:hypothetical protein
MLERLEMAYAVARSFQLLARFLVLGCRQQCDTQIFEWTRSKQVIDRSICHKRRETNNRRAGQGMQYL